MGRIARGGALRCSFCTKSQLEVRKLIAGPGVYICDECVNLCDQIIAEELARKGGEPGGSERSAAPGEPPPIKAWERLSDEELLAEMVWAQTAHENVDRAVTRHVAALRARGVSWARIGNALGMTRQSAWERFSGEE